MINSHGRRERRLAHPTGIPRVVFIMGIGRSGSTVLDLLLGQHPEVQSTGELCNVVRSGWIGREYCACGQRANTCTFWSRVRHRWRMRTGNVTPNAYEAVLQSVEGHLKNIVPLLLHRNPQRLPAALRDSLAQYATWTAALYQAIVEVSNRPVVVDSSKKPSRAAALLHLDRRGWIDLRLVHLVRDVRGFAWSAKKSFRKNEAAGIPHDVQGRSVTKSALAWCYVNTYADGVRRRHETERSTLLRYEDFVSVPHAAVARLATLIGVPAGPWKAILEGDQPLESGHVIAGNRVRMQTDIRLRPDTQWHEGLSPNEKRLCMMLASWKALLYGYRLGETYDSPEATGHECAELNTQNGKVTANQSAQTSRETTENRTSKAA